MNASTIEFTDVMTKEQEGYPIYRIPSLITAKNGDLLAFAEGRRSISDVSQNDIVMKRSTDNGKTWLSISVVISDRPHSFNNPTVVLLQQTGRLILFIQKYPHPYRERTAKVGIEGPGVTRNLFLYSDDNGISWSKPVDITATTKPKTKATSIASGPGVGIELMQGQYVGRILIPYNHGPHGKWENYMIYSDDHGQTWMMGNIVPRETRKIRGNEVQVIEQPDGKILLNSRGYGKMNRKYPQCRKIAVSMDGGINWSKMKDDPQLIEPTCQASLLRYSWPSNQTKSRILFSNPASEYKRSNGIVRLSYDEGQSWPISKVIWPDYFAYSCLTVLNDGTIGCLFETGAKNGYECLRFAHFSLEWLTDGKDKFLGA